MIVCCKRIVAVRSASANLKNLILCLMLLTLTMSGSTQTIPGEQQTHSGDTTVVNALLEESKGYFSDSPQKTIEIATRAKQLAETLDFKKGEAYALKNIGVAYYFQGKYLEALDFYQQSLKFFTEIKDYVGMANIYSNMGVVYYDQSDDVKALENYLQSLKYAELSGDKLRMLSALNNVGGVYTNKPATYNKALEYYLMALPICEELGKKNELGAISVNIGIIYGKKHDPKKALIYFNKAL